MTAGWWPQSIPDEAPTAPRSAHLAPLFVDDAQLNVIARQPLCDESRGISVDGRERLGYRRVLADQRGLCADVAAVRLNNSKHLGCCCDIRSRINWARLTGRGKVPYQLPRRLRGLTASQAADRPG